MATSTQIIIASRDNDLLDRIYALAEAKGKTKNDIEPWLQKLVSLDVDSDGNSIASVFEYAEATYTPNPRPGQNPDYVTDDHINAALDALDA